MKTATKPPLTPEQLALFEDCTNLAYQMAYRMQSFYTSHEDAKQVALLALACAARLFDPQRGVKFCSYAGNAIRNELMKGSSYLIRLPAHILSDLSAVAGGRALRYRTPPERLARASLTRTVERRERILGGLVADVADPADDAAQREEAAAVAAVLAKMKPRERLVMQHTYGIGDCRLLTRPEMAALLGISRARIHQLQQDGHRHFVLYHQLNQEQCQRARQAVPA